MPMSLRPLSPTASSKLDDYLQEPSTPTRWKSPILKSIRRLSRYRPTSFWGGQELNGTPSDSPTTPLSPELPVVPCELYFSSASHTQSTIIPPPRISSCPPLRLEIPLRPSSQDLNGMLSAVSAPSIMQSSLHSPIHDNNEKELPPVPPAAAFPTSENPYFPLPFLPSPSYWHLSLENLGRTMTEKSVAGSSIDTFTESYIQNHKDLLHHTINPANTSRLPSSSRPSMPVINETGLQQASTSSNHELKICLEKIDRLLVDMSQDL